MKKTQKCYFDWIKKNKSVTYCTYVRGRGTNANEEEHLEERRIKKCEEHRLDSPTLELLVRRGDGDDDGSLG